MMTEEMRKRSLECFKLDTNEQLLARLEYYLMHSDENSEEKVKMLKAEIFKRMNKDSAE